MPDAATSLSELFRSEESPLLRYAFGLLGRRATAEDMVQEAFFRLHRDWENVENPRAWLYRCVRNLALNERRDHGREVPGDTEAADQPSASEAPDTELGRHEAIGTLRLLMAELPPEDARLLHLKYRENQSYAAIASATGINIGTVGYKLHHLLKSLALSLRRVGIDSPEG